MGLAVCATVGGVFAIGIYLLLGRNLLRFLLGIAILTSTVNLIILIAGRVGANAPPFISAGNASALKNIADPLPQALILTAIVIGFGLLVFALILVRKIWQQTENVDSNQFTSAEPIFPKAKPK